MVVAVVVVVSAAEYGAGCGLNLYARYIPLRQLIMQSLGFDYFPFPSETHNLQYYRYTRHVFLF